LAGASKALARVDASGLGAFEAALALPGIERWPFDMARVQLAYGERLRRARSAAESREHLAIAVETFVRLGAQPWATRAAAELRATAPTRSRPTTDGAASLTPQEREVALLAAAGLTNKEIGARLLLSHRTVGAHLARTFRKLGISSRAALRDALGS
jgi:DNA-binding NarL/FixJ family response regulator